MKGRLTHALELLQNTRVQILVHFSVFEGIMGGLLRRCNGSIQML